MYIMKLKKVISLLLTLSMFLCGAGSVGYALFTNEEYYSCFEKQDSSKIIVSKVSEEDKETFKNMTDQDPEFNKYLGSGIENFNSSEYLELLEYESKLFFTVKNIDNVILGFVIIDEGTNKNQLSVGYFIGKEFRGKGYAHLAVSYIISKIWNLDKSVSFWFCIDDENIASLKTLEKICADLKTEFIKSNHTSVEIQAKETEDGKCLIETYINGDLINSNTTTKERILELYSEEKLESGMLSKGSSSTYLIENPDLYGKD